MTDDTAAPATRGDINQLKQDFGSLKNDLNHTMQEMKEEMRIFREEILHLHGAVYNLSKEMVTKDDLIQSEQRTIKQCGVLIENLEHRYFGFSKEKLILHDQQIAELQVYTGLRR